VSNSKARGKLQWEPKVKFRELVKIMVDYEMQMARRAQHVRKVES
jgi:GDP-D-mannose dehydratase